MELCNVKLVMFPYLAYAFCWTWIVLVPFTDADATIRHSRKQNFLATWIANRSELNIDITNFIQIFIWTR